MLSVIADFPGVDCIFNAPLTDETIDEEVLLSAALKNSLELIEQKTECLREDNLTHLSTVDQQTALARNLHDAFRTAEDFDALQRSTFGVSASQTQDLLRKVTSAVDKAKGLMSEPALKILKA